MRKTILGSLAALGLLWGAPGLAACTGSSPTWTSSADRTSVAQCVTNAANGDVINVSPGTQTWSSAIALPAAKNLAILGAGVGATTITATGNCFNIGVNDGTSSASRVSGFTFVNCMVGLTGVNPSKGFRVDHNRFESGSQRELTVSGYNYDQPPKGLIDHNVFQKTRFVVYGTAYQLSEPGLWQHKIWAQDPDFGGPQAVYIEDNTVDNTHPGTIDANYGGRYVYRFNTITVTDTYVAEFHGVQGNNRASQRWEIYGNTFNVNTSIFTVAFLRGATGYMFDNTVDPDFGSIASLKVERSCEVKSPYGQCDGSWNIDGNTSGGEGYPCRDQIGRSRDSTVYSGSGAWPAQVLTPAYSWNNLRGGSPLGFDGYAGCARESTKHSLQNRDWYNQTTSFNGTVGVGRGTLAARPATCTAGVAYWATDQGEWNASHSGADGQLFKCSSTNTWTLLYTPYTYPHPGGTGTLPNPPTDVVLTRLLRFFFLITRYVNTASTAGGDGTTNGTAGSTRAYASLQEAVAALPGSLSDAYTIYCEGSAADTLKVTPTELDFTTTATNYLLITTTQPNRHTGKYDTSKYRIEVTNGAGFYNSTAAHIRLDGLQIKVTGNTSTGSDYLCYRLATANNTGAVDHRISNCIAYMIRTGTDVVRGFFNSEPPSGGTLQLWNCIAHGGYAGFATDASAWATSNVTNYNCTGYGSNQIFADTQICINCIAASPTEFNAFNGTGTSGHSNNAATDTSAGGTAARDNQTFSFVNAGSLDFHLLDTDTGAQSFGLSDPGSGLFSTDIDGETRTGSWDIGADQITDIPPITDSPEVLRVVRSGIRLN